MTVQELIDKLSIYRPDMPVVTRGFDEAGYDLVSTVKTVRLKDTGQEISHVGRYDEGDEFNAVFVDF